MSNLKKYSWLISLFLIIVIIALFVNLDKIFNFALPAINDPFSKDKVQALPSVKFVNNLDGPLVEEFSDFECIYCADAYPIVKYIKAKYNGEINFVYKHMPNVQIHPNSLNAANAAECARDQDKFEEYHDILFENNGDLQRDDFITYAEKLDLDKDKFVLCYDSGSKIPLIQKDLDEGIKRKVPGTPSFFLNGEALYADELDKKIGKLLG